MLVVVAYDISHHKRRRELYKALKDFGRPRQESLFECQLDPSETFLLKRAVTRVIEPGEDRVRCYFVCPKCEKKLPEERAVLQGKEPVVV